MWVGLLSLNKISGEWDTGKLDLILEDLAFDGFDVSLTGFDVDLDSFGNLESDDELYDFLEEDNITTEETETLKYSGQVDDDRSTLPLLFFPLRNYIKLSYKEYDEIMEVYNKYVEDNGSDKGFATYLIAGRV